MSNPMVEFRQRLHAEGRWGEFVRTRDRLINLGVSQNYAGRIASLDFPPLDGRPHEIKIPPNSGIAKAIDRARERVLGIEEEEPKIPQAFAMTTGDVMEEWEKEWPKLMNAVPVDRTCSQLEAARWIYHNAGTPPTAIPEEDVPSRGALRHLKHVQSSDKYYQEFLDNFMVKTIPDRKAMENEARYSDDGRKDMELLDRFEREWITDEPEAAEEQV